MEYYNGKLCITHAELTDGIISDSNYYQLKNRNKIQVLRRGCYGTPALIDFESLPTNIKTECKLKYGDPYERTEANIFKAFVAYDAKAYHFFADYTLVDGRSLKPEVQDLYRRNAEVLNAINRMQKERRQKVKSLNHQAPKQLWLNIVDTCNSLKEELKHDLPENPRRLKWKLEDYLKNGYVSLISGKYLNNNAAKVFDIQQEAVLRKFLSKGNNFNCEQVADFYNTVAGTLGWDKITASTVLNYSEKWNLYIYPGRRGEKEFDNKMAMQVKRKAPILPMVYWTSDGWDVELMYQETAVDENGRTITTYTKRLTTVFVLDPCEKYIVGYATGKGESKDLIKEAFRNAIKHTEELFGRKHIVHQLQTDRFAKGGLKPFYEGLTKYYTPAKAGNAKSKVIEPFFEYLNTEYCQKEFNWSGFGLTANKDNQPNSEYFDKIKHSFPDEAGVRKQIDQIVAKERANKIQKYRQAYAELPDVDKLFISDQEYLFKLGETTGFTNKLSHAGLLATLNERKIAFDCFDVKFRHHASEDWALFFDPQETTKVLAVNAKSDGNGRLVKVIGELKFELEEKYIQPMALYDRKEGDAEALNDVRDFNKTMKQEIIDQIVKDNRAIEELTATNKLEHETLTKLLITDSRGQHKDNKNAARLNKQTKKIIQKQEKTEQKQIEKSWQEEQNNYYSKKVDVNQYI